ncbi:NAD-dependent epimerase/dehydratase family protein [Streptomyces sp. NPDC014894]|uniref:NAD-dependent epimerase/dehydratase family protein n=1 Tax=Streptomyces sp. NPDC014894 TaxID=3364931 RepID=UPI0036F615FC
MHSAHRYGDALAEFGTVAVTGGSGFIGRHLVKEIVTLGKRVVVIDLADPGHDITALPEVQHIRADLRDYGEVLLALHGVDAVFHLAGNASGPLSVENPRFDFQMNALGTCNVGEAASRLGVDRLVYLSSAIVYGIPRTAPITEDHPTRPFLPYGASKLAGELTLRSLHAACGLPAVIGRSFVVYGPGEDPRRAGGEVSQFLRRHLNEQPVPVVGDLDRKTRDFIHVEDLCRALIVLADRGAPGEAYNIGTGREVSMRELGEAVGLATSRPVELRSDPSSLEDTFRLVADVSALTGLGFAPRHTLHDGLVSLAELLGPRPELPSGPVALSRPRSGRRVIASAAGAI